MIGIGVWNQEQNFTATSTSNTPQFPLGSNYRSPANTWGNSDPFTFMRNNKKVYGFVMSMYEFAATIPTLWERTWEFIEKHPHVMSANNSVDFLVDERGSNQYNLCHFWSNFEIASLEFYRSETYTKYFEFLDSTGGFFYERWGDAPVHSLAFVPLPFNFS